VTYGRFDPALRRAAAAGLATVEDVVEAATRCSGVSAAPAGVATSAARPLFFRDPSAFLGKSPALGALCDFLRCAAAVPRARRVGAACAGAVALCDSGRETPDRTPVGAAVVAYVPLYFAHGSGSAETRVEAPHP